MKIKDITTYLEQIAPLQYQESYDNSGLLVGRGNTEVRKVLVSLDCTEDVVEEAIQRGCNLIISHHPIVFKGLKRFNGSNYIERTVIKAIQHDIALYAIHTNLDAVLGGVNTKISDKLGLQNQAILAPKSDLLQKLVVFVPRAHVDSVRAALFAAGAGDIGIHYEECSFNSAGYGTFKAKPGAEPFVGEIGEQHREEETRIEVVFPKHQARRILVAMYEAHPYEEVAYQVTALSNKLQEVGAGMIGNLPEPMSELEFLAHLKKELQVEVIRHTALTGSKVTRVAVCGGSGGFLLDAAKASGADFFVTADYKYHEFFDAEEQLVIADIGHYESEQFTQELIQDLVKQKFSELEVLLTQVSTNPVHYYYS
ncbi:Nif3-like dinuclear metal center hexameric protein [Sphingobacteriaceae bacterium WQ 2009]|uniref:GTP cyclohydrolase 1 type 2 homolog n=1 Tax=Rhinopithecimicrobium faecis TaxID=2820698 RepID=A0A8T4HBQ3_9SPHI|nr:Nif3-like dinuclear metal center hexameric protein [Sphingobacteriaceae bacterium WQ 2009]